jgi:hypothetical protein
MLHWTTRLDIQIDDIVIIGIHSVKVTEVNWIGQITGTITSGSKTGEQIVGIANMDSYRRRLGLPAVAACRNAHNIGDTITGTDRHGDTHEGTVVWINPPQILCGMNDCYYLIQKSNGTRVTVFV